ncbi:MAG: SDR family NAD(P)-dependent oxidoreductase [Hyphomicrobiaceae bacterium]
MGVLDWWTRRNWTADADKLSAFEDQQPVTLITGGSRGIGVRLAQVFARHRNHVVLVARTERDLAASEALLRANQRISKACQITHLAVDVTQPGAASEIENRLAASGLYVDELINNAGIGLSGPFADEDPAQVDALIALNVAALSRLTRTFLPGMRIRGRGGVMNISSLGGFTPGPYQAAYYASKSYVISLTQALAHENRGMGIRFSVVAPGPVETTFHRDMDAERAFYRLFLPALTATRVANSAYFWYHFNQLIVVPGAFNKILAFCLRILPGFLTTPVVAFLLNPRDDERDAGSESHG